MFSLFSLFVLFVACHFCAQMLRKLAPPVTSRDARLWSRPPPASHAGEDLITLTPSEIKVDLNITKLQVLAAFLKPTSSLPGARVMSRTPRQCRAPRFLQAKKIKRALEGGEPSADALADDAHKLSLEHAAEPPKVDTSHTDDYAALQVSSGRPGQLWQGPAARRPHAVRLPRRAPRRPHPLVATQPLRWRHAPTAPASHLQSSTAVKAAAAEVAARTATGTPVVMQVDAALVDTWTQKTALIRQLEADQVSTSTRSSSRARGGVAGVRLLTKEPGRRKHAWAGSTLAFARSRALLLGFPAPGRWPR